jgi:hypothetical protein
MDRYQGVHGRTRVEAIASAIEASGGQVTRAPSPSVAPFEFEATHSDGKLLKLVCYAFTANKYDQEGRPVDEHRMQVKYGSDFKRLHDIYIDPKRNKITLFFGVHEDNDLFVAVDPAMHHPTWFSSSIEFKEADVRRALKVGWHGWDRDRIQRGRRRVLPQESLTSEALRGFTPKHFLTYALFERIATGMETGDRLLLIKDVGDDIRSGRAARRLIETRNVTETAAEHELLKQFGLPIDQVLDLIAENPRLKTAVRGGVAERHLQLVLERTKGLTNIRKINEDGQPDFSTKFRRDPVRIECKNVSPERTRGLPRVDFQKTRAAKGDACSRYYSASQFEVLAACIQPLTGEWDFQFTLTKTLASHKKCPDKLSDRVLVDDDWPSDLLTLLS